MTGMEGGKVEVEAGRVMMVIEKLAARSDAVIGLPKFPEAWSRVSFRV